MAIDLERMTVLVVADIIPLKNQVVSDLESVNAGAIITAAHAKKAFAMFCDHRPHLVIADWDMAPVNGIELTKNIRRNSFSPDPMAPVILIAGDTRTHRVAQARDAGVTGLLLKPFSTNTLLNHVTHAMKDERSFIDCSAYVGPERRREKKPDYPGPFRRTDDQKERPSS